MLAAAASLFPFVLLVSDDRDCRQQKAKRARRALEWRRGMLVREGTSRFVNVEGRFSLSLYRGDSRGWHSVSIFSPYRYSEATGKIDRPRLRAIPAKHI